MEAPSLPNGHASACPKRAGKGRPKWEVADIFRLHGQDYRRAHRLPVSHLSVMRLIEMCRTARLGGHVEQCDACGYERHAYNSCRNRHCPKCQTVARERWLQARERDLLPVKYFHTVFTLPHELNSLILVNKRVLFDILFRSVAETLQDFAGDPRWKLGGQSGFIAVLHTWSQTLLDHFHIHCVIPAGVLSFDHGRWISAQDDFLFHVAPLSRAFRGKYLFYLKQAYQNEELIFPGRTASLREPRTFYHLLRQLYQKDWVVYAKRPFPGPTQVMSYLARYTHRVAISNHRIKSVEDGRVTFSYKDRGDSDRKKEMTLSVNEFIRRFLLHILPDGFMRIRYFGFLANRAKKRALSIIRRSLGDDPHLPEETPLSLREMLLRLIGVDIARCPRCKTGTMVIVAELPRNTSCRAPPDYYAKRGVA